MNLDERKIDLVLDNKWLRSQGGKKVKVVNKRSGDEKSPGRQRRSTKDADKSGGKSSGKSRRKPAGKSGSTANKRGSSNKGRPAKGKKG